MNRLLLAAALSAFPLTLTAKIPPFPEAITSFGAAVSKNTLYVYGGHTGPAHEYSVADQSGSFLALDLDEPTRWIELPRGPKLQGLALVAHGHRVYRLGGFTATNAEGEDHDLRSQAAVAVYDPEADRWQNLTPLPEPRSSFDATVLGDRVYVVGGWNLQGESDGVSHSTAWSADLTKQPLTWEALPEPPFQRRALSLAAHGGKIYAIGGMAPEGTTRRVDIYDPATSTWSIGPELVGKKSIDGFGSASRAIAGDLYVSSLSGVLQRLDDDGSKWTTIETLAAPRFFHAMAPYRGEMLLVGGANMSDGKLTTPEIIPLTESPVSAGH